MTCIDHKTSKRHLPAKLAAALAISAFFGLGTFVPSASAQDRGDYQNWNERGNQRGWDHRGYRDHDGWDERHYYNPPPVVYGSPYYYPPPVVYGPGIGLNVPGLSVHIR